MRPAWLTSPAQHPARRSVFGVKAARAAGLGVPIASVIGVAFCVEQPVAGAVCFAALGAGTYRWWRPEIAVRRSPAWAYRPVTFRFSQDGIAVQTEIACRSLAWADVQGVAGTDHAFFFGSSSKADRGESSSTTAHDRVRPERHRFDHRSARQERDPSAGQDQLAGEDGPGLSTNAPCGQQMGSSPFVNFAVCLSAGP
jgi:hypothetical protein